jgi:hypothetical protein
MRRDFFGFSNVVSGFSSNVHEGVSHAIQQIQHPAIQHNVDLGVSHAIQQIQHPAIQHNVDLGVSHAIQQIQHPAIQHKVDLGVSHAIQQIQHPSKLQVEIGGLLGDYASATDHLTGGALGAALAIYGDLQDLRNIAPGIVNGNLGDYFRGLADVTAITTSVAGLIYGGTKAATLIIATDALITLVKASFGL